MYETFRLNGSIWNTPLTTYSDEDRGSVVDVGRECLVELNSGQKKPTYVHDNVGEIIPRSQ